MAISATYDAGSQDLTVTGDTDDNAITVSRNGAGNLFVNNGAVPISGGTPTVANTDLIAVSGDLGNDVITLDETNGALPAAELAGGGGNDTLTGGSNADTLAGEDGDDALLGRGGIDLLYGGAGSDTLTGGDANDTMDGGAGNDLMIWNPGDDSDLIEGGDDFDTVQVNGGGGGEVFTITANGTRVRFDRVDPAPFALDIGTTEVLQLNAGGGDDTISTSGNLAALIGLVIDGGAGSDTILGGNGIDTLIGNDGNDVIDGNQGNDFAFLGAGEDIFQWDPGDGNDTVEGQDGTDLILFNGSAANEIFDLSANGARTVLTRNVGAIVMDINDLELFTIRALGGTDTINLDDLGGTDAAQITVDLAGTIGGVTGDAAADIVTVDGSGSADTVTVSGSGTGYTVTGLTASITVLNSEGASDSLVLNGLGGDDIISANLLAAGVVALTIDAGAGHDVVSGSAGADVLLGGDGDDLIDGNQGADVAFLGAGNDTFQWDPGDGSDVVEGQADFDELLFNGSNATENIDVAANGGRVSFFRDVAAVAMDLDDIERITYNALGGSDNVVVGNLTGTDAVNVDIHLAGSGGGGDGAADTVAVNATNGADVFGVTSAGGVVSTFGLPWTVSLFDAEVANDSLVLNALGGDDVIDASGLAGGFLNLTVNGGLGADVFLGSSGNDLFTGGDGNDLALLGSGNDTFVWNPGDDNDTIEGQAGLDTLLFNGSNVTENLTISPNGGRIVFFRDIASVTVDLDDTEAISFAALGGADNIVVNDLAGTDATQIAIDLASTVGGVSGDAAVDTVTLSGSGASNAISLSGTAAALSIAGLPWTATINQIEATDVLNILAGDGNDSITTAGITGTLVVLMLDGGGGNDTIQSTGDGTYLGGTGDDLILAGLTNSSEVVDGGDGIDTLDTRTWAGIYTLNMVTGLTNYSGELFTNFENVITGDGQDAITGTSAANWIRATGGADNVAAGDGDDVVEGGAQGDTLDGGVGSDTLDYDSSSGGVTVSLIAGTASGGDAEGDTFGNFENLRGSAFDDTLLGDNGANTLIGGGGTDTLEGFDGNDFYFVDNAGDVVIEAAGEGSDRILASVSYGMAGGIHVEILSTTNNAGTDSINLTGNELANSIAGNNGNNVLNGLGGADTLNGLGGNDWFFVDNSGDTVIEFAGGGTADRVLASVNYTLGFGVEVEILSTTNIAGTDAINLTGNALINSIVGNAGANSLNGLGGADTLNGLGGDDWYFVDQFGDIVLEVAGGGSDRIFASSSYAMAAGVHVEILSTSNNAGTDAINLAGNELVNSIAGNNGNNTLNGLGGADTLNGLGGDDWFLVDNAGDTVIEFVGGGTGDRILTSVSYAMGAGVHVEILSTTNNAGTGAINLTGNELVNGIVGNAGDNTLNGGAGADVLNGLGGNDFYFVDQFGDVVVEAAGGGSDRIFASSSYAMASGVHVEILSTTNNAGVAAINLAGNELVNSIAGNAGNNVLNGLGGADTLNGLGGNDSFHVDQFGDVVVEAAGGGSDRIFASSSYAMGAGVHVEILSTTNDVGTVAINLAGNELANSIVGNAGANVLNGLGGSDTLNGLGGADTYRFSTALGVGNVDTVVGYAVADDTIQLDDAVFTGLAAGALAAGAFNTGAAATQADDRIIYNTATGALLFDADGTGGIAAIQFATLSPGLAMSASEFFVI